MSSGTIQLAISETDSLRKMLNYIADCEHLKKTESQLKNIIAESFKRHEELILAYIKTTNEIHQFIELAGKDFRLSKIRHILHKTDVQCTEIIQQFGWMLKYIDAKLMQSNCTEAAATKLYEDQLSNLQQSLQQCEIHKKNRKSANLVRKIRVRINSLIEKINTMEKKIPEKVVNVISEVDHSVAYGDDNDVENLAFDLEDY